VFDFLTDISKPVTHVSLIKPKHTRLILHEWCRKIATLTSKGMFLYNIKCHVHKTAVRKDDGQTYIKLLLLKNRPVVAT